ncbi:MAG: hypothetical protein UW75_C0047G0009 [Parcubacteria group bacterium GW2011_GWF2_44_8]|nr:MAG: hypothetical protein UW75_C0047G0009 [Parcubacteria group bacterium GW2011_GWF2_44_8]
MNNLAPDIARKRLLIEAKYKIEINEGSIRDYFSGLTGKLNLRTYGDPIIHSPSGQGKEENQGYDAFVPLIDSGIALYVWSNKRFLSCVLYTCRDFSTDVAIEFTKSFFETTELESEEF